MKKEVEEKFVDNFGIIKINLEKKMQNRYPKESIKTLHNYTFEELNNYENRNFFQILYIFLLSKQIIFHSFLENSPFVPFHIKFNIFLFTVSFDLSINALFYSNQNITEKSNSSKGLVAFTFSNNKLIIIISTLVSLIFIPIIIRFGKN